MKRTHALLVALIAVSGCRHENHAANPQSAKGDTPIRYVICGVGASNCFVAARFDDFDSCEAHKKWADMSCEYGPDKMVCHAQVSDISSAYCTN